MVDSKVHDSRSLDPDALDLAGLKPTLSERVAGVDEAGRGPLAGPVCAAAVILNPAQCPIGIADSKLLSAKRRETLAAAIEDSAIAWAVAFVDVAEIDRINILQASLLAMRRALDALRLAPTLALIDGNRCPEGLSCASQAIVRGDRRVLSIGAASILAKVARDQEMCRLDQCHPGYGFAQHKGYGTKAHLAALDRLGPCIAHRRSFAPVRSRLEKAAVAVDSDPADPTHQRGAVDRPAERGA
ncbi:MAG: ribonuclease HII [Lamprobacter sp.]|uniref:ribonuclease HII n=1 Tax=Lamprobacter sp. TaxID=3100796 RepID=UPI002B25867B|nr:ribonuclease HII [Lamprobacter sp.]MEA3639407.1 ribonuclease HII [Lamprobacter sp.]